MTQRERKERRPVMESGKQVPIAENCPLCGETSTSQGMDLETDSKWGCDPCGLGCYGESEEQARIEWDKWVRKTYALIGYRQSRSRASLQQELARMTKEREEWSSKAIELAKVIERLKAPVSDEEIHEFYSGECEAGVSFDFLRRFQAFLRARILESRSEPKEGSANERKE